MSNSLLTAAHAPRTKYDLLTETQAAAAPGYEYIREKPLRFWDRLIQTAVADAKRTYAGMPTDNAILQRNWIERRTAETDRTDWERSFECACQWLGLDPETERKRLLTEINDSLVQTLVLHAGSVVYQRSAAVLSCATGVPRRIGRQFVLALVSEAEYELIAGINLPDPPPRRRKRTAHRLAV